MIENNLLKSNFLGRDGFRWWIGQIPPSRTWLLQFKKRPMHGVIVFVFVSWGIILKIHKNLKDEDLPWATVILPTNNGSGKAGFKKPIRVNQGDIVVGFFMDGDDAQLPVIFGVIGNSRYVVNSKN